MIDETYTQLCPLPPGYRAGFIQSTDANGVHEVEWVPVIALALERDGTVVYLTHDEDGRPSDPREQSNFLAIAAPGRQVGPKMKVITKQ